MRYGYVCYKLRCFPKDKAGSVEYTEKPTKLGVERSFKFNQGDNASEPSTVVIRENGSGEATFGSQYNITKIKGLIAQFKIYHLAGVLLPVIGILIWKFGKRPKVGIAFGVFGVGCAVFGSLMPQYGFYVLIAVGLLTAFGVGYFLWRHGKVA